MTRAQNAGVNRSRATKGLSDWIAYNFAVLNVVPHAHVGACVPVGIVIHARTTEFLSARLITDRTELAKRVTVPDMELLSRYLESCTAICAGSPGAGPIALAPPSERFHWITAPRSDVIQSGPVHEGLCDDPMNELDRLFHELVDRDVVA